MWTNAHIPHTISGQEGILLGGRKKIALKITICPETNFFSLIWMGTENSCKSVLYRDVSHSIRGVSHKLFSNFLHNRMQCTKIWKFKSSYKRISCGVPQGSAISPLLFLIYINDITKASSFHTTLFADDIILHISNSSFNVLQTTVNLELCTIDHWLRANKLSLNCNKTNFMLLTSRKHNPASFKVTINNHTISPEDNLKYLGVLLDNKLNM